ncbi:MAG: HAD family phosphatase [Actinomycetota bacterium]|nr:HAD family phosphatase [Actinomycetota bacterium]
MTITSNESNIDAVLFDWGGVITVPPGPIVEKLYRQIDVDQDQLRLRRKAYRDDDPDSQFARLERGELSLEAYLTWSRQDLPGAETIWDPESAHFLFRHLTVVPEVVERIYQLKERGFLIGLLTNNIAEAWPTVNDGLPIDDLFDVAINSAFVGMRKPEHRIYVHALEKLGVRAEHAVFLDDNPVNLEAARACGLNVVEVKQPVAALEKLEAVIKELAR